VYGGLGPFDVNAVEPAVMQTIGVPPEAVAAIVQRRHAMPFRQAEMGQVAAMADRPPAASLSAAIRSTRYVQRRGFASTRPAIRT
jgi:hypothetical protein